MIINNPPKKKKHKALVVISAVLLLTTVALIDSRFRLVDTEYELLYKNLPKSFEGYRVVQLSDLHMEQFGDNNEYLLNMVTEQSPDIIVLTGDIIKRYSPNADFDQVETIRPFLERLSQIAPCYFVSGNHEWASREMDALTELLEELNIIYLHNEFVLLEKGGDSIVLAGVEDPNGPADMIKPDELADSIAQSYQDKYTLLLAHRNDWMIKYPDLKVDTILCGHAHGGIVRLPFAGGVFGTDMDFFPKYDKGIFNEGNYDMVISGGLGGYRAMPRFLNNPEVVTMVLKKY